MKSGEIYKSNDKRETRYIKIWIANHYGFAIAINIKTKRTSRIDLTRFFDKKTGYTFYDIEKNPDNLTKKEYPYL